MTEVDEVLQEFIIESNENLDELDRSFVALEANPGDRQRVSSIFRAIHTIKGGAGAVGLRELSSLAHEVEQVLDAARSEAVEHQGDIALGGQELAPHLVTRIESAVARVGAAALRK